MRIRNLSGTEVPRALWSDLATAMGFGGWLPEELRRQWPFYYDGRTLHVTVNRRTTRNVVEGEVTCGSYAFGNTWLYPCPKCTDGFLTYVFLYVLCDAWLDAFHPQHARSTAGPDDRQPPAGRRFPLGMGSIARFCSDRPVERRDAQAERIARTALEGVCMPLLRTSSEPSAVVSTRVTVAVT